MIGLIANYYYIAIPVIVLVIMAICMLMNRMGNERDRAAQQFKSIEAAKIARIAAQMKRMRA